MIELTVKVSNEEKRMTKKHLIDEGIMLSRDDPTLIAYVHESTTEFASDVDDVKLIITMVW